MRWWKILRGVRWGVGLLLLFAGCVGLCTVRTAFQLPLQLAAIAAAVAGVVMLSDFR